MKRDRLLLIGALVQFALFVPVTLWARKRQHLLSEIIISRRLQKKRPSFLRPLVQAINSAIGSALAVNLFAVLITFFLWRRHLRLEAVVTIVMCWTGELVRQAIKKLIDRPRPNSMLVPIATHPEGKSFPSGDVASSLSFWGWLLVLAWHTSRKNRARQVTLLSTAGLWILLVGPARIYLGAHWMSDVIGGYLFGGGWLSLTLYFYHRWRATFKNASSEVAFHLL